MCTAELTRGSVGNLTLIKNIFIHRGRMSFLIFLAQMLEIILSL